MEIICNLIKVSNEISDLPQGAHFLISSSKNTKQTYVEYAEFQRRYQEAASLEKPQNTELDVVSGSEALKQDEVKRQNGFDQVVLFILEKIDFKHSEVEGGEIIIKSDFVKFLELPWEQSIGEKIVIIRRFYGSQLIQSKSEYGKVNNLVILMSHAYKGIGADLEKEMKSEIKSIYNILTEQNHSTFKTQKILFLKHTSKDMLKNIEWEDFNFLHLIAHGDSQGFLALEATGTDYKSPDLLSSKDFLDHFQKSAFDLIFLSNCYSGGGLDNEDASLALRLIESGCTHYSIGYREGTGEDSAKQFAEIFYETLVSGVNIEEVYKKSLLRYYQMNPQPKYIPFLFARD